MTNELPHAIWSGSFHVYGVEVKCHTLSNGERIIEKESFENLMAAMGATSTIDEMGEDVQAFAQWKSGR